MEQKEFDLKYCKGFHEQQLAAVHAGERAVLLLAVPGSGKTTVLIARLGYLILCRGVEPGNILTMTYTVAATGEMRSRFAARFGETWSGQMTFCTINSLATAVIRYYAQHHGRRAAFPLIEDREAARLLGQIYREVNRDFATEAAIRDLRTAITYVKNSMVSPEELEELDLGVDHLPEIFARYNEALRAMGRMDFDDQLTYAHRILTSVPAVLDHFRSRYPYLCVDESQDTSKIQHEIIRLLTGPQGNLFLVGDEDQSIYGFRAAYPQALLHFEEDYPGGKVLFMERNYRSTKAIVSAANGFVARNRFRREKTLRPTRDTGAPVRVIRALDRRAQFQYLFEVGRQCREETAILFRNNDSALPLMDRFQREGIPYNCRNMEETFFSGRVVQDVTDILRFALAPGDTELFLRIYYKFGCRISKEMAQAACGRSGQTGRPVVGELLRGRDRASYRRDALEDLADNLAELPKDGAQAALQRIWGPMKYGNYVRENDLDGGKLDILLLLAGRVPSADAFLARLEELRQLIGSHKNSPGCPLTLSTVHSSKGLEYERVYLLDTLDGILPAKNRMESREEDEIRQYEEERRIFYVAMTRAKEELYLFSCQDRTSEFVTELLAKLPRLVPEPQDLFAGISGDLTGKAYADEKKGRGRVLAQWEDRLLVEFGPGDTELLTLAQMVERRQRRYELPRPGTPAQVPSGGMPSEQVLGFVPVRKQEGSPVPHLEPGDRVLHSTFGSGVIQALGEGIAEIQFSVAYGRRRIAVKTSFQRGILRLPD